MFLTAKYRLYPTEEQARALAETQAAYTAACNFLSAFVFESKIINQVKINQLKYRELRDTFKLPSQMAQSVMRTVAARYRSIKSNKHEWTLVRFTSGELEFVFNRDYSVKNNVFSIITLEGRIKVPFTGKGMERHHGKRLGSAKAVFQRGHWFLCVAVEHPEEAQAVRNIVGVDFGLNFTATAYDSKGKTTFFNGRRVKHKRARYKALRKQLQQKQTPSARRRLKQVGQRESRYVRDVNHCVSKALVQSQPAGSLFVIEDLTGVRAATEKVHVRNRYVSVSWAFHQLRQFVEYKAALNGSSTLALNPTYTSQTCPKCGHVHAANRNKKLHLFKCRSCGYGSNDDRAAAMNLHRRGIERMSQEQAS